ncbi:hypothetical protein HGRIS_008427 [Hohenbuehelia grisea]|uniref:HIRAN domain-containing protein n=1 Tax=Hohenbuehelia grisea TaxID=104357 RepID=A0ABR3J7X7_9AGAR
MAHDDPGLFFASSDDEDADVQMINDPPSDKPFVSPPRNRDPLFLQTSDDEDLVFPAVYSPLPTKRLADEETDTELIPQEEGPRASSVSSLSSAGLRSDSPILIDDEPPKPRQPPLKKRRISTPVIQKIKDNTPSPTVSFDSAYLGSFITTGWSTVKGKGYIKVGDALMAQRDEPEKHEGGFKSGPGFKQLAGKGKKKADGKKQISIATMLKPKPQPKALAKKADSIVRLTNSKGFEFGRLAQETASWVAHLLDLGIVDFRGTMIECPDSLYSGVDCVISLSAYLLPAAFKHPSTSSETKSSTAMFDEGQETTDERTLRERKASLLRLFDEINLKPQKTSTMKVPNGSGKGKAPQTSVKATNKPKKTKTEIVGDGEEVEVEEGEELSTNDIDMIYKKAQQNDQTMGEMEPAESFTLTLRGYQKQALLWMHSIETGTEDARDAKSMHPLWTEYAFPPLPSTDDIIDLTDDRPFYFNPYSGELSLQFPKAVKNCRGGILA